MSPLYGLLGLLVSHEHHGYELKRIIDRDYAPFWRIDAAQLYRSLARLSRDGWIRAHIESGSGGPARKIYRATPQGRVAFAEWLAQPAGDRDEWLVKLRLARGAGLSLAALATARARMEQEGQSRLAAWEAASAAGDPTALLLADAALKDAQAALSSLDLAQALFPAGEGSHPPRPFPLMISGSDDPLLERLARSCRAASQVIGSLGGLLALLKREADVAAIHLLDMETGEYNLPLVRRLLPEDDLMLVNLAYRDNGLMIAPGNPHEITSLRDLARPRLRLINRPRGTGTRLLLAVRLRAARLDPHALEGWERTAATHAGVAAAVRTGQADAGPGLRAVALEWGLEFIPLGEERFDLVIRREDWESARMHPLLKALQGRELSRLAEGLPGYNLSQAGRVLARVK